MAIIYRGLQSGTYVYWSEYDSVPIPTPTDVTSINIPVLTASYAESSAGGGGGASFWFERGLNLIYTTGSVEITGSLVQGDTVSAGGSYSHAEGQNTNAVAPYSHTEGYGTSLGSAANWSHIEGYESNGYGIASHAEGYQTVAGWSNLHYYNHTEGYKTRAASDYSHAEGQETKAYANGSHVEGKETTAGVYGYDIISIDTITEAPYAIYTIQHTPFAFDLTSQFNGNYFTTDQGGRYQVVSSNYSGGMQTYVTASDTDGYGSYIGSTTIAVISQNRNEFPAFPQGNRIGGIGSHVEGTGSLSVGEYSHAEGDRNLALGPGSHAEGVYNVSLGQNSHAEGFNATAFGIYSHAEGIQTIAFGLGSHAEGAETNSNSSYSHAEGYQTITYGNFSHAEGSNTIASGSFSHAEGLGTRARGDYQHVQGKYNVDNNNFSLMVIGDGDGPGNRSDIVRVNSGSTPGTGVVEVTGSFSVSGTQSTLHQYGGLRYYPTIVTSLPYTASLGDYIIAVSASSGLGIALPSTVEFGRTYVVKDVSGSATADNISVSVDGGGVLIDGSSAYTISINNGSATFVYFGSNIGWGVV